MLKLNSQRLLLIIMVPVFLSSCKSNPADLGEIAGELQITAATFNAFGGQSVQLSAVVKSEDGTIENVTTKTLWTISPGESGSVNANGLFVAFGSAMGMETITAEYLAETTAVDIQISPRATAFTIVPVLTTIPSGSNLQFSAIANFGLVDFEDVSKQTTWTVSPGIAAMIDSNGLLTTISGVSGSETITAGFQKLVTESEVNIVENFSNRFEMVEIPAGSFIMGDDNGRDDEKPAHEIFLDAFTIGKFEVTNREYVEYLNAAQTRDLLFFEALVVLGKRGKFRFQVYMSLGLSDDFLPTLTVPQPIFFEDEVFAVRPGFEQYPVIGMTRPGANAFCDFYGLRLPTEAEWEKACRAGQQLEYGTANGTISHDLANLPGMEGRDIFEDLAPVGTFPPNPFGIFDMACNANELVHDFFDPDYYKNTPMSNPTGPESPVVFDRTAWFSVARGGQATTLPQIPTDNPERFCRAAGRGPNRNPPQSNSRLGDLPIGFRVARSLQ